VQDAFHGAGAGEARPQGADARSAASGAETYNPDAIGEPEPSAGSGHGPAGHGPSKGPDGRLARTSRLAP
jgi:hypothetical protein